MAIPHAVRFPEFSDGRFIFKDITHRCINSITYEPIGNKGFKHVFNQTGKTWYENGKAITKRDIIRVLNTAGTTDGYRQAVVTLNVRDYYLPSPYLVRVERKYRYLITYLSSYNHCLDGKGTFVQKYSHVSVEAIDDDKPLCRVSDVVGCKPKFA